MTSPKKLKFIPRSRDVYNWEGDPQPVVFNEKGHTAIPKFDKFGRLLYQIYDFEGYPLYDRKGRELKAIYTLHNLPRQTVYDRHRIIMNPKFDEFDQPTKFMFDKHLYPLYDEQGNPWRDATLDEIKPKEKKKKRKLRKDKRKPLTMVDKQELLLMMEELRIELRLGKGKSQKKRKNILDYVKEAVHSELEVALDAKEATRTPSEELHQFLSTEVKSQLDKTGLKATPDGAADKGGKHVTFDILPPPTHGQEACEELDPDALKAANLSEVDRSLDSLECLMTTLYNAVQTRVTDQTQIHDNVTMVLLQMTHLLNKLFSNSKILLDENQDIGAELEDQHDLIKSLEVKKTMSREMQEALFNEINDKLTLISTELTEKVEYNAAIGMLREHTVMVDNHRAYMAENEKSLRETAEKYTRDLKDVESRIDGNESQIEALWTELQKKECKEHFAEFTRCFFECLRRIEDYINRWMTKPVFLSGGRTPEFTDACCISCGKEGILSKNAEKPLFPVLNVVGFKNCAKFRPKGQVYDPMAVCFKNNDQGKFCVDMKFPELDLC